ncbi:MAG: hypothetical protein JWM63_4248, partial [Gammaproteobacteria bacterium]|nr:hypothetical protein [Gammaproteobacteria bacterium]
MTMKRFARVAACGLTVFVLI